MSRTTLIFFAALVAITLYCYSKAPAATRHHFARPHHAHLEKHPRILDVLIAIPRNALAPKPPANHHRKTRR